MCGLSTARPVMRGPVVSNLYIYIMLKSLPNPKDTLFHTHIQIQREILSLIRERHSH